jgi:nicotinamide-nucleotide amidase
MFNEAALPILQTLVPGGVSELKRVYRITGIGESHVEERIGVELLGLGIELGYCARPGEVDVRIIGNESLIERAEAIIRHHFAAQIVSMDESSLEKAVIRSLTARAQTLGVAESCTGGFLAHHLTNVPGASKVFQAGFVTYANESKTRELGVDAALINEHGAVSAEVALAMARGVVQVAGVDYALATTGIAGPDGGTPVKPVGSLYIALASRHGKELVRHFTFRTDRETFKTLATQTALNLLRQQLE